MAFFTQHNIMNIFPNLPRAKRKITSIVLKTQNQLRSLS